MTAKGAIRRTCRPVIRPAVPVGPGFVGFSAASSALAIGIPLEARAGVTIAPAVIHEIGAIGASLFGATSALCAHRALAARDRAVGALAVILFGPGAVWTWLTFVAGPPPSTADRMVVLVSAGVAIWLLVRGLERARWVEVYCGLGLLALTGAAGLVPAQPGTAHGRLTGVLLAAVGAVTCLYGTLVEIEVAEQRSTRDLADSRRRLTDAAERTEELLHDVRSGLMAIEAAVAAMDDNSIGPVRMEAARLRKLMSPSPLTDPSGRVAGPGFDLVAVVRSQVELARAGGTAVELQAPESAWVQGCDVELASVVENLLANAERHGRPPVVIRITTAADGVELAVTDQGPGIAPEMARHLFRRGATSHPDGHGIGLYRARAVAARYGGELACRPTGGGGNTFVLRLPGAGATAISPEAAIR